MMQGGSQSPNSLFGEYLKFQAPGITKGHGCPPFIIILHPFIHQPRVFISGFNSLILGLNLHQPFLPIIHLHIKIRIISMRLIPNFIRNLHYLRTPSNYLFAIFTPNYKLLLIGAPVYNGMAGVYIFFTGPGVQVPLRVPGLFPRF